MNDFAFYTQISYALTAIVYVVLSVWVAYRYRFSKRALMNKDAL